MAWHLSPCRGSGRQRASLACLVAPRCCAAPRPIRLLSVLRSAFLSPWCLPPTRELSPPALLGGCAEHVEASREPGSLRLPLAPAEARAPGALRIVPVRGPAMGLSLAGPSGFGLGLRVLRWLACVDPVTDASGFPYRPSFDGGLGRCTGAVSCGRRHLPFLVGGRHIRVPRVCVCACSSWPDRAGRPPGRALVRLTFSLGRSWCALCFLGPLRAWVALFFRLLLCLFVFCFFFFCFFFPLLSPAFRVFQAGGPWAPASCGPQLPPPPVFFFSAPPCLLRSLVPARGAVGLGALWSSRVALLFAFFCFFSPLLPPPPLFLVFVFLFLFFASAFLCFVFFSFCLFFFPCPGVQVERFPGWFVCPGLRSVLVCVAVSLGAPWLCPFCVCCCLSGVVVCFVWCVVLCGVPVLGLVLAPRCCLLLPSPGPPSWPVVVFRPAVPCCVALVCRLSCGVLLWCRVVWFALAGAVWCCLWLLAVRCWVWLLAVVSRWRVLSRVLLPGGVACCPAASCALLWCPALLCSVLCSVVLCCRVVPCCGALLSVFLCWWCCFVSFPCVCGAVLRCASCCSVPVWSALLLVPRAVACRCVLWCLPGRSVVLWCCSGVSRCLAVPCVVLWCPVPCAVSCGAVLPCVVVLAGCAVQLSALLVFVIPFVLSVAKNPCCFSVPLKNF